MSLIKRTSGLLRNATKALAAMIFRIIAGLLALLFAGVGMSVAVAGIALIVNSIELNMDAKQMDANADAYADYLADRAADRRRQ